MKWTMAAATLAAFLSASVATAVAEPIELQWWHPMTSVNADRVNKIAADFNASQTAARMFSHGPVVKGEIWYSIKIRWKTTPAVLDHNNRASAIPGRSRPDQTVGR